MARFATSKTPLSLPDVHNLAGGQAHRQSPKLEFASALSTSFLTDTYYKTGQDSVSRIAALAQKLDDPLFAAKAALFTRKLNGLRSVSHLVAGELAKRTDVKGQPWLRKFYRQIVIRPDDITEVLSYLKANGQPDLRKLSNAMKRGFGEALSGFDAYQLGKYKQEGKDITLIDAVNLLHPKATEPLTALMKGTLAAPDTWETKLSAAGKTEDVAVAKGAAWADLLAQHKLGYTALVRNLRNIAEQAPGALPLALEFMVDPKQVAKSMFMPFQFLTALEAIEGSKADTNAVKKALSQAMELSVSNVPVFEGKTLLAVDGSGSMRPGYHGGRKQYPLAQAALMAAVLFKSQPDCDVIGFANSAQYLNGLNPGDTLGSLAKQIERMAPDGGTDFHSIFRVLRAKYDRLVILSDMQAWVGYSTPAEDLKGYRRKFAVDTKVYSFDLTGHGTLQFPESKVFALAGFTDAVLGVMKNLEEDPQALIHKIEAVVL